MWNNYTVEMQNPGRIEDHLAEARANALEAEARDPRTSFMVVLSRRTGAAVALRASRMRLAATARLRATRHQLSVAVGHLRHLHPHRPAFGHRA